MFLRHISLLTDIASLLTLIRSLPTEIWSTSGPFGGRDLDYKYLYVIIIIIKD